MLLFFYGTLVAGNTNAVALSVHERLVPRGAASTRGLLYAIGDAAGWYPAMVPGDGEVHGQLYAMDRDFSAEDLAALDRFENCNPARPERSDYERVEIMVRDAGGSEHRAQAYRWLRRVGDAARIDGGNFPQWLAARGLPAYHADR